MIAFDKANRRAWVGQATAYEQTFARLCAHSVDAVLDAAKVGPGVHVLDGLLGGGGLLKIETDMFAFTHRIDPESWWSGPAQGLASMGAVVINQTPEMACVKMACVMKTCYDHPCRRYLGSAGMLHLPTAAVLASGRVPDWADTP